MHLFLTVGVRVKEKMWRSISWHAPARMSANKLPEEDRGTPDLTIKVIINLNKSIIIITLMLLKNFPGNRDEIDCP